MANPIPLNVEAKGRLRAAEYVRMSTDHQQYSILNQSALIHAYAEANDMEIVTTYSDHGKSGLTIKSRPGLSRLLADVVTGAAAFEVVLVYDISRWGRFQDADESAHYEFICRRAGIRVVYCAEQFGCADTPFSGVLKALKRAMAAEYSRELSVKVALGKARIARLGFRVGGIAGYGLRRQVLEEGKTRGVVLRDGQRKSIQTDRVVLVPGPAEELRIIRRIYRDYIYLGRGEHQIACDLNAEGLTCFERRWSRNLVRTILSNEKYVGNHIVGRFARRLRTPQIINPPQTWIRHTGAFQAVVPWELFEAAARVRRFNEKTYIAERDILKGLHTVLKREGRLTAAIINRAPDLPSANTVELRFGSLGQAYEKVGYVPPPRYAHHAVNRALRLIRQEIEESLVDALSVGAPGCARSASGTIAVHGRFTVEVIACRHQQPSPYNSGWRIAYQRHLGTSHLLAVRMAPGNQAVRDFLVVPRTAINDLPIFIRVGDDGKLSGYRHESLEAAVLALAAVG